MTNEFKTIVASFMIGFGIGISTIFVTLSVLMSIGFPEWLATTLSIMNIPVVFTIFFKVIDGEEKTNEILHDVGDFD